MVIRRYTDRVLWYFGTYGRRTWLLVSETPQVLVGREVEVGRSRECKNYFTKL